MTGYDALIDGLRLPDADDRHVLAAAIRCNASVIVTFNRKDFPDAVLSAYGIEAQHPDVFVDNLFDLEPSWRSRERRIAGTSFARLVTRVSSFPRAGHDIRQSAGRRTAKRMHRPSPAVTSQ